MPINPWRYRLHSPLFVEPVTALISICCIWVGWGKVLVMAGVLVGAGVVTAKEKFHNNSRFNNKNLAALDRTMIVVRS